MANYTYVRHVVSPKEAEKRNRRRRERDGVPALPSGFTLKPNGRQGFIYYRQAERVLELYWEMSGVPEYDILLNSFGLKAWVWPATQETTEEERVAIGDALEKWLTAINYKAEIKETPL